MIGLWVTGAAAVWLVTATLAQHRTRFVAKAAASAGFVLVVALDPLDDTTRAALIALGLALGAVGDLALMGRGEGWFLAGLGAFLAGHVAYAVAFGYDQGAAPARVAGASVAVVLAVVVGRWLRPRLHGPFRVAVPVYIVVICVMVALAIGASSSHPAAAVGAALFAASDLFVARERFVEPARWNPAVGLPLYYAGQVLIAVSAVAWS
ncbi:MAG: lysoplasmalogenase [Acidimicrobiales bacterium]